LEGLAMNRHGNLSVNEVIRDTHKLADVDFYYFFLFKLTAQILRWLQTHDSLDHYTNDKFFEKLKSNVLSKVRILFEKLKKKYVRLIENVAIFSM
jgi:hypothetical protein